MTLFFLIFLNFFPDFSAFPPDFSLFFLIFDNFFTVKVTSWLFSFKPCARFKTIFIKIESRVMMRRCVIARWVQRKTDFPLKLHTNRVFCHFCLSGYTSTMFLSYLLGLMSKNMCKHTLTHIIAKKCNFCLKKIAKNHDFGNI